MGISIPIRQSIAILMDNGFEILREFKKLRVLYTTQLCLPVIEMLTMVGERDPWKVIKRKRRLLLFVNSTIKNSTFFIKKKKKECYSGPVLKFLIDHT